MKEFNEWANGGNVEKISDNVYIEHTTQWRKNFTLIELIEFYTKQIKY